MIEYDEFGYPQFGWLGEIPETTIADNYMELKKIQLMLRCILKNQKNIIDYLNTKEVENE
jgi:hypothetical protein